MAIPEPKIIIGFGALKKGGTCFFFSGWVGRMILICNDFQHRDFPAVCLKKKSKRDVLCTTREC